MATAALPSFDESDTTQKFEKWLKTKIGGTSDDELMFASYLVSIISDEESTQEDKLESIKPLLQELNQNFNLFKDEDKFSQELIDKWNQMKLEDTKTSDNQTTNKQSSETPTDTILSMINKHKSQIDTKKHATTSTANESCDYVADYVYESDEENKGTDNRSDNIAENTNAKDAKEKERIVREKLAEAHIKQKEQSKKALIEQREKELEKKKQKQAKAAKVERKR